MFLNKQQDPGLIGLTRIFYTLASSVVIHILHYTLQAHKGTIFLLLYADDIIITSSNLSHVSELVRQLVKEFAMKDLGPLHFFLGVEVRYFDGGIHLS